jgi:SAM-dependent methyltransferase
VCSWFAGGKSFVRERARRLANTTVGRTSRAWLRRQSRRFQQWPPVGLIQFGSLRRLRPISRKFGFERGQCIDRYYIERFLETQSADIRGRVLEVGERCYTTKFGADRVVLSDVLHATVGNPQATIVGDFTDASSIPPSTFDCVILTQTLHLIYDCRAAVTTLFRVLKPGGVVLATVPGISQISRYDMDRWGDCWRFTSLSARRLFEESFPADHVQVESRGNVLAAVSFLHGLAREDVRTSELDHRDPDYELVIMIRAIKPAAGE